MASLFYLREEMESAYRIMNDKTKPFNVRRAARHRWHHCMIRVGTMERGGFDEDEPGHYLRGYGEEGF